MTLHSKRPMAAREGSRPASAQQRLKELGIKLPVPQVRVRIHRRHHGNYNYKTRNRANESGADS